MYLTVQWETDWCVCECFLEWVYGCVCICINSCCLLDDYVNGGILYLIFCFVEVYVKGFCQVV